MNQNRMKFFLLGLTATALVAGSAQARDGFGPTDGELMMLPRFCTAKLKGQGAEGFRKQFGANNWIHMHHYCFAETFARRAAFSPDPEDRKFQIGRAVNNYDYVLRHTEPRFFMRSHIRTRMADALFKSDDPVSATRVLRLALRDDEKHVPAYLTLSAYLAEHGERAEALELVTRGLRYVPNAVALQKRYLELGGSEPFPEPVATARDAELSVRTVSASSDESAGAAVAGERCRFCPPESIQQRWAASFESNDDGPVDAR